MTADTIYASLATGLAVGAAYGLYRFQVRKDFQEVANEYYRMGWVNERPTFWNCRRLVNECQDKMLDDSFLMDRALD